MELQVLHGHTQRQAAAAMANRVSVRSIQRFGQRLRQLGHVHPFARLGKSFGWSPEEQIAVQDYVDNNRDIYLDELVQVIVMISGRLVTERAVWWLLKRMRLSRKKLSKVAHARSEAERAEYVAHMRAMGYLPEQLVFFDETGTNTRDWCRNFGRSLRCVPFLVLVRRRAVQPPPAPWANGHLCVTAAWPRAVACRARRSSRSSGGPATTFWPPSAATVSAPWRFTLSATTSTPSCTS